MTDDLATRPTALGYVRVRPYRKLSPTEKLIAGMLGRGYNVADITRVLNNKVSTTEAIIHDLAAKIPGDLRPQDKIKAWIRGASYGTLTGLHLPPLVDLDAALVDIRQNAPALGKTPVTP